MSLGGYFEGLGVPLGGSSAQLLPNTSGSILFLPIFEAKWKPERHQNVANILKKVGLKFDQKINAVLDRILIGFCLIFGALIDRNLNKNQDPQAYQSKKAEGCKVL